MKNAISKGHGDFGIQQALFESPKKGDNLFYKPEMDPFEFDADTKKLIMANNPMFPMETKAMMDAFKKEKSKRYKSIKNTNTKKLLNQEKRGWSFIQKFNDKLDRQFHIEYQTPSA